MPLTKYVNYIDNITVSMNDKSVAAPWEPRPERKIA